MLVDIYWTGNLGEATPDLSRALRCEKSKWWSFLRKCDRIGSIFGGIDSHAWRSEATTSMYDIYEQDAGLAAQPPHLKEQRDELMRLWRGVSTSWCNQLVDWEATLDLSRALRCEKSRRWSFLRKCDQIGSIFGGIDSTIMESSRRRELLNEVLLVARGISFQSAAIS